MPLNIEDAGQQGRIPRVPPGGDPGPGKQKRIYPWLLLILVISAGVFLLFQFGVISPGKRGAAPVQEPAAATPAVVPDTAVHVRIPAEKPATPPRENDTPHEPAGGGNYTIVISAFNRSADAEEMADRWTTAGFNAGVQHASGWYRVTLGRFETVSEAKAEAERLREALEEGYWITRINI